MEVSNLPEAQSAEEQSTSGEQSTAPCTAGPANNNVSNTNNSAQAVVGGAVGTGGPVGPSTTPKVQDKRKLIQLQLVLLLHANQCRINETQTNGEVRQCSVPNCFKMKQVLAHLTTCQAGKSCTFPYCSSTRQINSHWKHCPHSDCPVCVPLKQALRQRQQQATAGQTSQSYPPANMERACAPLGRPYMSGRDGDGNVNSDSADSSKDWRQSVDQDLRQHLVQKIVRYFFPTIDLNTYRDSRMIHLVAYAEEVENDQYKSAKSREDYYQLIAENIYKIEKELEEIHQNAEDQQLQQQEVGSSLEPMLSNNSGTASPEFAATDVSHLPGSSDSAIHEPGGVGLPPGISNPGALAPGKQMQKTSNVQVLQQLLTMLKSPSFNVQQQKQQVLHILKSNPQLVEAFIKQRSGQQQEKLKNSHLSNSKNSSK